MTRQFPLLAVTLGALLCSLRLRAADSPTIWGPNLMPNAGFEEVDGQGGPVGWTLHNFKPDAFALASDTDALSGARCLLITRKSDLPDAQAQIFAPFVPLEPGWYLFSLWRRYDWTKPDAKPMKLLYVERRSGTKGEARNGVPFYFYDHSETVSGQWQNCFALFQIQPGDFGFQMRLDGSHVPEQLRIDALQLRRLLPPAVAKNSDVSRISDGYGVDRISDPQALNGLAWRATAGKNPRGSKIMGGVRQSERPGLYRATWRFRQIADGGTGNLQMYLAGGGGQTLEILSGSDFRQNGVWQEFTTYFFYPYGGGSFYSWSWQGKGTYDFDHVALESLAPVTSREAWAVLGEGVDFTKTQAPAPSSAAQANPVWLACGLYTELTGIETALAAAGLTADEAVQINRTVTPRLPALTGRKLVVLAGVPATAFNAMEQLALQQFVRDGGGLIVFGGPYGFGHGGMTGSFIAEMLPVALTGVFDLLPLPGGARPVKAGWFTRWGECAWVHRAAPKPGATVVARTGGQPALVTGTFGKGRVVAVTATVLGEPRNPFWENAAWQAELRRLTVWAARMRQGVSERKMTGP